ncbi:DUF6356 family protein [Legionella sp. D16C41]|uniref:DUF6356 family protein n=1 Tax=Legionella sp. D16C41 TaxID=3402688 RepID=UPI003AF8FA86
MKQLFTKHPNEIGESYFQHMAFALKFSFNMFLGAVACFLHGLFPFTFQKTGSNLVLKMFTHLNQGNRKDLVQLKLRNNTYKR